MAQQFAVDDDLVTLVWRLAKPKPFEHLSFSEALRRVLQDRGAEVKEQSRDGLDDLYAEATALRTRAKKAPSPSPAEWVAKVPELKSKKGVSSWKAICDVLRIDTAGDSARRRLKNWVKANRPSWPPVPEV